MRQQRTSTVFTDQQLVALERSNALTGRERRLLATIRAKPAVTESDAQYSLKIKQLESENAKLRAQIERLLSELKEEKVPQQEEHIEGSDITRACPKCGRTKAFIKLYDFAGCVKCGRTWQLKPDDGIEL